MAEGHIRLGATAATLRDYLLVDPRNYRATSANPMAARVSTGSQYGDLQAWSTFLMADWQAGVGKVAAEGGGFLFSEAETRAPQQVILPAALGCSHIVIPSTLVSPPAAVDETPYYMPASAAAYSVRSVGGTGNPTRISIPATIYATTSEAPSEPPRVTGIAVYGYIPNGVEVTVNLYANSGGAPGSVATNAGSVPVVAGTYTAANYRPGYQWHYLELGSAFTYPTSGNIQFHWVIYPTDSADEMQLVAGDTWDGDGDSYDYSSGAWTVTTTCPLFVYDSPFPGYSASGVLAVSGVASMFIDTSDDSVGTVACMQLISGANSGQLAILRPMRYDEIGNRWTVVTTTGSPASYSGVMPDDVGGSCLYDGVIYIPQAGSYSTWTLSSDTLASSTNDAHVFASWAGYLWRAYNNQLWYSTDGSTWTAIANDVGPSDYRIRGMAGFGQYLYVATDEALYYVAPGDVAVGLFPWSTVDERNGRGMVVHQGALYIPVAGRILRYSEDGSLQDVWVSRDDDLNNRRLGEIAALAGLSNWLVAGVNGTTSSDPASVWAFTQQGWHHLATLPPGYQVRSLYYDRIRSRLWIASDGWAIFYIHAPDWALNPYNDSTSTYMAHGWMEIARVYGGLRELRKDWESVRLFGEMTATGQDVTVYWQDAGTTTWTSLGTATADAQELRWSDYSTRPNGRWLRLAFLLATDDPTATPKIEAVATKLLPMVTDREAWNLAILVSDDQEMIDGDINPYTADEMISHLRGLVQQVPPFIFEDVDGTQYEVKAQGSARNIQQYEWLDASQTKRIMWIYEIAVEQVTSGAYSA